MARPRGTLPRRNTAARSAEIRPNFRDAPQAGIDFASAFSQIVADAIDKSVERERDFNELVTAMNRYKKEHGLPGSIPDQRTLLNWCKAVVVPQARMLDPVWAYLFREKPDEHPDRIRLKNLWQAAEDEKNASSMAKRRAVPVTGVPADPGQDDPEPGASDWQPEAAPPLDPGAPVLRAHAPPRGSNTPNAFPLQVELSIGEWEDWVEGQYLTLALTDATLHSAFKSCQPAQNTQLGRPGNEHDNLEWRADVWRIKGPRLQLNHHLDGEPAGNEPLCTVICAGGPDDSLTLTLRSSYRALAVVPREHGADANVAKEKVLQALLQKCHQKEPDGFITWGRATLKRKARDATDG